MTDALEVFAAEAIRSLAGPAYHISEAEAEVPDTAGLYAVHAAADVWRLLQLDERPADVPLYVGKSESSLVTRELKTHFAIRNGGTSKTGSSTVRRSFAALLREPLQLRGVPRNTSNPGHFAMYSLDPDADERLTAWMHEKLTLAVWAAPADTGLRLKDVEKRVLAAWQPPINLDDVASPSHRLKVARTTMADEARQWQSPNSHKPMQRSKDNPADATEALTPADLSRELNVSQKRIRDFLRTRYGTLPPFEARWLLNQTQAAEVRSHF